MPSQIRAAFDIGSSHHKMTVARVEYDDTFSIPSVQLLHSSSIRVGLADALNTSKSSATSSNIILPEFILSESRRAIQELQARAHALGAHAMCAIATAVFRSASNGSAYLASLGMPVQILSPLDEGTLAFHTALYYSDNDRKRKDDLVVWDSGGGSTQFTTMMSVNNDESCFDVFALPIGSGVARATFKRNGDCIESVKRIVRAHVMTHFNHEVAKKIQQVKSNNILAIGNESSMFAIVATEVNKQNFTQFHVNKVIENCTASSDIHYIRSVLPKLILLQTLMQLLNIESVKWIRANGSCVGLLLSEDQRFWPSSLVTSTVAIHASGNVTSNLTTDVNVVDIGRRIAGGVDVDDAVLVESVQ